MARRDASDPREPGIAPNWAWAWPANRRILYNRASADLVGQAVESGASRSSSGTAAKWAGIDVPDYAPTAPPSDGVGPFIMNAEGRGPPVRPRPDGRRAVPRALRAVRSRRRRTCCIPRSASNPAARVYADDRAAFGTSAEFPYVGTTYRLTEHFHFWTKHALINAILQPEQFVEIGEALAKEKGIEQGGWVRVASKRGAIVCKAYVTKRIKPLMVDGKPTHVDRRAAALGLHRPGAARATAPTR